MNRRILDTPLNKDVSELLKRFPNGYRADDWYIWNVLLNALRKKFGLCQRPASDNPYDRRA